MDSFSNNKNINFMVFENQNGIEDYLSHEIVRFIKSKRGLNLAIESRVELFGLANRLREECIRGKVSFSTINYFMTDDYIFDLNNWDYFQNNSNEKILKKVLFNETDFLNQNFHSIVDINRFNNLFDNVFNSYDALIDAYNGLDVLVLKLSENGSLIFNESANSSDLSSKAINMTTSIRKEISHEFSKSDFLPVACATLGIDQILKTRKIYIVGTGIKSANMLQKLFYTKDYDKNLPICLLKSHPNISVIVDKEASAGIFKPTNTKFASHYPTTNLINNNVNNLTRDYSSERKYYRNESAINPQMAPVIKIENLHVVPNNKVQNNIQPHEPIVQQQPVQTMYQHQVPQQPIQTIYQPQPQITQQPIQTAYQPQMTQQTTQPIIPQPVVVQPVVVQPVVQPIVEQPVQPAYYVQEEVPTDNEHVEEYIEEEYVEPEYVEEQQITPEINAAPINDANNINIIIENNQPEVQQPEPTPIPATVTKQPEQESSIIDEEYDFDSLNDFQDI